ncbi:MAG: thiamine ABC transporter substrate-binding protein, partial [Chloroflexi bacterium]|nr:thiamine ABC transporter substrate-binding protein [Chloroflexota bacterium]
MKRLLLFAFTTFLLLIAVACQPATPRMAAPTATPTPVGPQTLVVMTHDSFEVSEEVMRQFEEANHAKVTILKSGDTGSALNKAILSKDAPLADVFYGVDNTFLSRALDAGIFEPYASPMLDHIPDTFKMDPQNRALPVDYGDVCLNYDKAYFQEHALAVPQSLEDLTKPEYKGLLVVENPATSSPGLAFMLATVGHFGPDRFLDYWKALKANDVLVVDDWNTAYFTHFSGSAGKGAYPLVVSYGTSPAAEVYFASTPIEEPPTAAITAPDTCFRQVEFVGILKGTKHRDLAEKFVDFMLDLTFQQDIPLQMWMFPVRPDAELPDVFVKFAQV